MENCTLTLQIKNEKIHVVGKNLSLIELAALAGYLQTMAGYDALKRGMSLDEIKLNMLDIHLAAMDTLEKQRKEGTA